MLKEMKNVKDKVKMLLQQRPELRDNDRRLLINIWCLESGGQAALKGMTAEKWMIDFDKGKYSNSESIRRVRAKLQEDHPELRGRSYNSRKRVGDATSAGIKKL